MMTSLDAQGVRLADLDLITALTALSRNLTLITTNQNHLQRIPGLKLDNWASTDQTSVARYIDCSSCRPKFSVPFTDAFDFGGRKS